MALESLPWEEVKPIWDNELWPGRDSEPVTSMKWLGGYDMEYKKQTPIFIGLSISGEVIGVNSFVRTEDTEFRSRGLWVHPDHRGCGLGKRLLHTTVDWIADEGGTFVWTMPREEAMPVYASAGFVRASDWIQQEWGTNCYAGLRID